MTAEELLARVIKGNSDVLRFGPEDWDVRVVTECVIIEMIEVVHGVSSREASAMLAEMIERMYP